MDGNITEVTDLKITKNSVAGLSQGFSLQARYILCIHLLLSSSAILKFQKQPLGGALQNQLEKVEKYWRSSINKIAR